MRIALILGLLLPLAAHAQDTTTEDKLRDALRHSTVDLRALQDTQAQLQADRDAAVKQHDTLQAQLTEAQAKLAAQSKVPEAPPVDQDAMKKLTFQIDAQRHQIGGLQTANGQLQGQLGVSQAALVAKTGEAKQLDMQLHAARDRDATEHSVNARLVNVSTGILHLYETQDFRAVLVKSYEPLIGLWMVRRDNIVQDWDDKIAAETIYPVPTH